MTPGTKHRRRYSKKRKGFLVRKKREKLTGGKISQLYIAIAFRRNCFSSGLKVCLLHLAAAAVRRCQLVMSPLPLTTSHPTLEVRNEFYRTTTSNYKIDAFLGDAKPPTVSMKKLIKSPFFDLFGHDLTSDEEEDVSTKALEAPTMLLEEGAVANALRTAFV